MPLSQVQVGSPSNVSGTDGQIYGQLGGKSAEAIVAELHGKFYTQAYRKNLWSLSITTASAIPLFATNATPNFFIYNPPGNPFNVVPVRLNVGFHGGTGIAGAIGYSYISNVPALAGGTGVVSAATTKALQGAVVGAAYAGQVIGGSAATITGVAPYALTQLRWSNLSQGAPVTGTAALYSLSEDFDGTMIIPPGTLWCPTASTAVGETAMITLIAYEAPL